MATIVTSDAPNFELVSHFLPIVDTKHTLDEIKGMAFEFKVRSSWIGCPVKL